jgi:eukaryotic-like serine/threonine-protein kinase
MFFRGETLGKYKIVSSLGSGGFAAVYLAEDTWIRKKVALKVPHKQQRAFATLVKEPRLLASLSHPNIVSVLTAEREGEVFFIVMEYVEGDTLEQVIGREGPLDVHRALDLACQMCNGLEHAHASGVLHRDIRPSNMLVTPSGVLKIADFGTSRIIEVAAHGTTVVGSPPYMAPEQFYGKAVFASDLYSVGVTLYQMLTGELPYGSPAPADVERLARGEFVASPRVQQARMPPSLRRVVLKALSPDVASRYQRAPELLADLLAAHPTAPRRPQVAATLAGNGMASLHARVRARDVPAATFCWHCRKALPARAERCPFCQQAQ